MNLNYKIKNKSLLEVQSLIKDYKSLIEEIKIKKQLLLQARQVAREYDLRKLGLSNKQGNILLEITGQYIDLSKKLAQKEVSQPEVDFSCKLQIQAKEGYILLSIESEQPDYFKALEDNISFERTEEAVNNGFSMMVLDYNFEMFSLKEIAENIPKINVRTSYIALLMEEKLYREQNKNIEIDQWVAYLKTAEVQAKLQDRQNRLLEKLKPEILKEDLF